MQKFRVDLKTFLGLAMSNQCCHAVNIWQISWWDFWARNVPQSLYVVLQNCTMYMI